MKISELIKEYSKQDPNKEATILGYTTSELAEIIIFYRKNNDMDLLRHLEFYQRQSRTLNRLNSVILRRLNRLKNKDADKLRSFLK